MPVSRISGEGLALMALPSGAAAGALPAAALAWPVITGAPWSGLRR